MTRFWSFRWLRALVVGGSVATLSVALYLTGLLDAIELKTLDTRFQLLARPERADPNVVMVAIDESSLAYFEQQKIFWPWPRDFYGQLEQHAATGGARAVAYDILFPNPDIDRVNADAIETDGAFAEAIRASRRTILATLLGDEAGAGNLDPRFGIDVAPASFELPRHRGAITPLAAFQEHAQRVGVVNYVSDVDGTFRRTRLAFQYGKTTLPTLSMAVLMHLEGTDRMVATERALKVGTKEIPLARDGTFLAYWYGRGGPRGPFKYVPFAAVVESAIFEATGREAQAKYPAAWFKDKVVVVGASAGALFDNKATPFTDPDEGYPGMEIHATLISNFLRGDYLRDTGRWVTVLLTTLLALLAAWIFFHSSAVNAGAAVVALEIAFLAAAAVAFSKGDRWIEVAAPSAGMLGTLMASAIVSYVTEGRSKREMRKMFDRYVSPAVVNELLADPTKVDLGGKTIEATIFFSDVADFTSISEKCQPAELVEYLNDYFSRASDSVLDRGAMLDKYIGDAIMAVFGAPVEMPRHAQNACLAALAMQRLEFRYGAGRHDPPLEFITRIGINSGKMVVGNIGSSKRLDYTAIGDNVNLGSRLEGVNKVYGTRIIVSESTAALVKDEFVMRELDLLTVKGKTQPIRIYELIEQAGAVDGARREHVERFHAALALYRDKRFVDAGASFQTLVENFPADAASKEYVSRCDKFVQHPPPENWDGVYALKTK